MVTAGSKSQDPASGEPEVFAAAIIESGNAALAAGSVERLFDMDPALRQRWEPGAYTTWTAETRVRLEQLVAALRARRPMIFAAGAQWTARAIHARGAPIGDFTTSLRALARTLAEELPERGASAVAPYMDTAFETLAHGIGEDASSLERAGEHAPLAAEYLALLLEAKRDEALEVLRGALAGGLDLPGVYRRVLGPALDEIGRLWVIGDIHIGEEHACTASTRVIMAQLLGEASKPPAREDRMVLTASVEGNAHEIGIRMVADIFELHGWRSIYLGTSLPPADLVQTARNFGVHCVCLSAMLTTHLDALRATIAELRADPVVGSTPVIVGGKAFADAPDLWRDLGADGIGDDPCSTVSLAEQLVSARIGDGR